MGTFSDIRKYRDHFLKLIELERSEEINKQITEIKSLSGIERQRKGRAILGLNGRDSGTGIGGTYLVKLVLGEGLPDTEISIGDLVLASKGRPNLKESQAVVVEKSKFSITIAYQHNPPYFVYQNNIRLDLFANDITFQRMKEAVLKLPSHHALSQLVLTNYTINNSVDKSTIDTHLSFAQQLNGIQQQAVNEAIIAPKLFLIHGPPGTGKTTTLTEFVIQAIKNKKKIIATSDSNTAVDNLLDHLLQQGAKAVRIGNPARIQESLLKASLDYQIQDIDLYQLCMSHRDQIVQLRERQKEFIVPRAQEKRGLTDRQILDLAKKKIGGRGVPDFKIRKMAAWIKLQHQINQLADEANSMEQKAIDQVIGNADVVCATHSAAGSELLKSHSFDISVIDEAGQSTEPACLIAMLKAKKWVMAGDHKQLPPTILSDQTKALSQTLFERWMVNYGQESRKLLSIQYRMHQSIMHFPNESFYDGKLVAHPSVAKRKISELAGFYKNPYPNPMLAKLTESEYPSVFIHVAGEEKKLEDSYSYFNRKELEMAEKAVHELMACRLFPEDIGVISPYQQQVNQLKNKLNPLGIEVKTVDGFQGREKEVIIISFVRSNLHSDIGFLRDYRRLNVSLTRAKRKLIMMGNKHTLSTDPIYHRLVQYHKQKHALIEWDGF